MTLVNRNYIENEEKKAEDNKEIKKPYDPQKYQNKVRLDNFYKSYHSDRVYTTGKCVFLPIIQALLLTFLLIQAFNDDDMEKKFITPTESALVVLSRLLCALILHIGLTGEIKQGLLCMKYAISHKY